MIMGLGEFERIICVSNAHEELARLNGSSHGIKLNKIALLFIIDFWVIQNHG